MPSILLAEDDEFIGRMLNLRLSLSGHSVDHVVNGQLAVEKALEGNYDVVLMDMHMPIMDGHKAASLLRDRGYSGIIVAVTASVMSADSGKAIASGCDDYIPKPIGDDFEQRLDEIIKRGKEG